MSQYQNTSSIPTLNIGYLCSGWQVQQGLGNKTAMRWVAPDPDGGLMHIDYSFTDLDRESNHYAHALGSIGLQSRDVMAVYLPQATQEIFFGVLGALKAGLLTSPVFASIGKDALFGRLEDSGTRVLLTKVSLYKRIKAILPDLPKLEYVILVDAGEDLADLQAEEDLVKLFDYQTIISGQPDDYEYLEVDAEHPSLLHYTSGSTGKPKGVLHAHGGIGLQITTVKEVFQPDPDDLFWCTADQGWVTGTTYGITAPWACGMTQLHYCGVYDPEVWFGLLQDEKVTIWYTAPTALRMIIKEEDKVAGKFNLSDLKRMYSVGEPLNPEIIRWVEDKLEKIVYDTWFQTETGCMMITNRPGVELKPGSMGKPLPGIVPVIADDDYHPVVQGKTGRLTLTAGWPSMFRTYLNNEDIYNSRFHPSTSGVSLYDTNDLAFEDEDGHIWYVGRSDDVINTSGHLVGPFEVESALLEMPEIVEAGVIGAPDPTLHEKVVAFIVMKKGEEWNRKLEVKVRVHISNRLGPIAVPLEYVLLDDLPKNRSGKIMRRVLKAQYLGEDVGDTSTML